MTSIADARGPSASPRTWGDAPEHDAWAVLSTANGVGPVGFGRLIERHGSAIAVLELARSRSGAERLVAAGSEARDPDDGNERERGRALDPAVADAIVAAARDSAAILERMRAARVEAMTLDDADYPARLLALELPPPVLFVRGDRSALSGDQPIAVVGTRRPTEAGRRLAMDIGSAIARAGGVVVSGLALGIDGAAHAGAVQNRRPTVAVLGSGHGQLHPRAHESLADAIVTAGGCVISELGPDVPGSRGTFPRRNRVISGLSEATVVVEAPHGSGALITAEWALEQGRECFVAPGPVGAPASAGCLAFLRAYPGQARIVATVAGLLEDLGFFVDLQPAARPAALDLGEVERRIVGLIIEGHATVDDLVSLTSFPVSTVLSALTLLEVRGLVAGAYGRYRPQGILLPDVRPRRRISGAGEGDSGTGTGRRPDGELR